MLGWVAFPKPEPSLQASVFASDEANGLFSVSSVNTTIVTCLLAGWCVRWYLVHKIFDSGFHVLVLATIKKIFDSSFHVRPV